jgi:hypothetical protein
MNFSIPALFKPDPKKGWTRQAVVRVTTAAIVVLGGTVLALALIAGIWESLTGERMYAYHDRTAYDEYAGDDTYGYPEYNYGGVMMDAPTTPAVEPAYDGGMMGMGGGGMMNSKTAGVMMSEYGYDAYMPYEYAGPDAELYEHTSYSAFFDTHMFEQTCAAIVGLKPLEYVVFTYASESASWCSYEFKVETEHAQTVADAIRALHPEDFSVNTATVAGTIDSQEATQEYISRRIKALQDTRDSAEDAYASLLDKAVTKGSVSELTNVINSKLATTERLNREIQNLQEQQTSLEKNQSDTLDSTQYETFSVQVQKRVYVDWKTLGGQWRDIVRDFVERVNGTVLTITFGLIAFVLEALVFVVFVAASILGLVVITKYMLRAVRYLWKEF